MNLSYEIDRLKYNSYSPIAKILDYIWTTGRRKPDDISKITSFVRALVVWRASINKMRVYSSPEVSLIERINASRTFKDIDSLIFRLQALSKINISVVSDNIESENKSDESDDSAGEA